MKRRRTYGRHRLSRDAEHLIWLAQGLADSGSRLEDAWWEGELNSLIDKLLRQGDDDALNLALDKLNDPAAQAGNQGRAYEELADLIEAGCETSLAGDTSRLLVALPILAWSRYAIPTRLLGTQVLNGLRTQLGAHVLAQGAQVQFADFLFSPDQLPQGYSQTRAFTEALWKAADAGQDLAVDPAALPQTQSFVSDVRYLLAAVSVASHGPVFRWNEPDGKRETALAAWREQGAPNLQSLLTGCTYECLLPDAYFAAWRRADQETRPFALTAAVAYLQALFDVPVTHIKAVVAPYYEHELEEWRVGFTLHGSDQVVHGVTWPLMGQEDEGADIPARIDALLRAAGVTRVDILDTRMPLEYCDDCGAPLFPNRDGENVHTEMPEDTQSTPTHLH
ncbi:MAG: DUF2863 family protein [Pseudomonadota bacterium]